MKVACVSRWVRLVQIASCQPPFHNIVVSFVTSRAGAVKAKRGEEKQKKRTEGKRGGNGELKLLLAVRPVPLGHMYANLGHGGWVPMPGSPNNLPASLVLANLFSFCSPLNQVVLMNFRYRCFRLGNERDFFVT